MAVLAYHKVDDRFELGLTTVSPTAFARQVAMLRENGYGTRDSSKPASGDQKGIMLTFDDGYDCFYRNVVPCLNPIGWTATVFVITDFIGRKNDWDLRLSVKPFVHMDEKQLKEISKMGFEVGSHSCSHKDLTRLSRDQASDELDHSKKRLEDLLGREVMSFSFPYGRHDGTAVTLAKEAGYSALFGLGSKVREGVIERTPVYRLDSIAAVKRKVEMNRVEILKSDFIHSFANVSALISGRNSEKLA